MFIVHLSRPFFTLRRDNLDYSAVLAYRCLAATTVGVGIYGQFIDSRAAAPVSWLSVHTLFGAVMYCAVTARFIAEDRRVRGHLDASVYEFSRHVSRLVYLLLYGLVGIAIAMTVVPRFLHGILVAPERQTIGIPQYVIVASLPSLETFRPYLAHGIMALLLIRVEAAALIHHRRS